MHYDWDDVDNLRYRRDLSGSSNLQEDFTYDGLNRLLTSQVTGKSAQVVTYDSLGNIESKSDVGSGNYIYGEAGNNAGPHAVSYTPNGVSYEYDKNGNLIQETGNGVQNRSIEYSSFDKPLSITKGGHETRFAYGPERKRYMRIDTGDTGVTTTLYLGNVEQVASGTEVTVKRYIQGVAITTETYDTSGGLKSRQQRYTHSDHLGSLHRITDESGKVVEKLSFDPWGKRRSAVNWAQIDIEDLVSPSWSSVAGVFRTTRGYTGHEMLDEVGLIHMNGRIYDPHIARFVQADPYVQSAANTQSLNRYSYLANNPLNATDPSGYFLSSIFKEVGRSLIRGAVKLFGAEAVNFVGSFFATYWGGPIGAAAWAYEFGRAMGMSTSQAMRSGVVAGVSAYAFQSIGDAYGNNGITFGEAVTYTGVVGGAASVLQGGKFGHGFVAAGAGMAGGTYAGTLKSPTARVVASVVVGGTVSEMTGGKFANGASTAAFVYLMSAASEYYEDTVGRKADPLPGENKPGNTDYQFDQDGRQYPDSHDQNVIGLNKPMSGDFWEDLPKQGGPVSKALNMVPTVNATAGLHDYWFNKPNPLNFKIWNVPTMLPAAAISISASIGNLTRGNEAMIMSIYHMESQRRRRDSDG